jgi:hypothetical protein
MTVDGNWELVVDSPVGKQHLAASLTQDGGRLTGTIVNQKESLTSEILDGAVDGDQLRWKVKLNHINMTLSFDTTVTDGAMSGKVKAGLFGRFTVTGTRTA